MKKIILSLAAFLCVLTATAQLNTYRPFSVYDRIHYWGEAGVTYNKVSLKQADYKLGFKAGLGVDIPFLFSWASFCPSVTFASKGFKSERVNDMTGAVPTKEEIDMMAMYVQVPLDFSLNIPLGKKTGIQVAAGPYIAYGVAGNYTISSDLYTARFGKRTFDYKAFNNPENSGENDPYPNPNRLKHLDIGADLGVRLILFYYVMVKVNAEFGFMNMSNIPEFPGFRNRSLQASLAIRL